MAAFDYFLKIDGIQGESTDAKHKDEIEVLSWSWGETQERAPGSASAIGTRLPASPQPSSSTRQPASAAGCRPNSVASVARRSGCVCANGCPGYGTASYGDSREPDALRTPCWP